MGKGFFILSALLLMFAVVGCDDSDTTDRDTTGIQNAEEAAVGSADVEDNDWNVGAGDRLTTAGRGDAETVATATLNASFPKDADGNLLAGNIEVNLETRDGLQEEIDGDDFVAPTQAEMAAAGIPAAGQNYMANFNTGDDVMISSFGEAILTANVNGTEVDQFDTAARAVSGGVSAEIDLVGSFGADDYLFVFGIRNGRIRPVAYAEVMFRTSGKPYVVFPIRYTGRYFVGFIVAPVSFSLDEEINNACNIELTLSENGVGTIFGLLYSSVGDIVKPWTATSTSTMNFNGSYGNNQTFGVKTVIGYQLFGFDVYLWKAYIIDFDCLSGAI
jgi:hypothetical protein